MKSGHGLLELLKDPHKNMGDPHDPDAMPSLYGVHGLHPSPAPQPNGNVSMQNAGGGLGNIFLSPQGSRPLDDKTASQAAAAAASMGKASELEKLSRQLFPAQHMRNLFEMQAMKNDPGQLFSAFAHMPADSAHLHAPYAPQLYNSCQMKLLHQAAALRGRSEGGLQRAKSEPNIAELYLKKKDKNGKRCCPVYQVQPLKNMPMVPTSHAQAEEEAKAKGKETTGGRGWVLPEVPTTSKANDVTATTTAAAATLGPMTRPAEARKSEKTSSKKIQSLKLADSVLEKLNAIDAKFKVEEQQQKAAETGGEKKDASSPDTGDGSRKLEAKEDAAAADKPMPSADVTRAAAMGRNEPPHEQSIVVGEPPEPVAAMGDFSRFERDLLSSSRSQNRRNGRPPFDLSNQGIHPTDVHLPLIQMAHGQGQRQPMARVGVVERQQMQPVMEAAGPNAEFPAHLRSVYPYFLTPAQFPQMAMYNMLSAQEGLSSAQMTLPRGAGMAAGGIRHPALQKVDGRTTIVDLFPGSYHPWFPAEGGVLGPMDRRMNGSLAAAFPGGWNNVYASANAAGPSRPHEDGLSRDSDDVLSGDIETLTQQLEVARNFIGCKTPAPSSSEKDRSGRSSSSSQPTTERTTTTGAAVRKSSASPPTTTVPNRPPENRTSSRERQGRHPMDTQTSFNPAGHVQPAAAAPVGFPANFTAQSQNVLYPMHPNYMAHPPPPPGTVSDRMTSETELMTQSHVGATAPGFGYQSAVRGGGVHVPMAAMNVGGTAGHLQGAMPHAVVDSATMQLPPQPPRSASPGRSRDAQVIRSGKTSGNGRYPPAADGTSTNSICLPIGDGQTVEIDASVFQAVKAAMAENASDDHASRDPNNRVSRDPNSPRHFVGDGLQRFRANGGGINDPPAAIPHPTSRRQLEEGVMCFSAPMDFQTFQANRPMTDMGSNAANGTLAHFFTNASQTPAADAPMPQRMAPTSYGTGGFIPIHAQYVSEQRKAREQQQQQATVAEKESQAQGNEGNAGEDGSWSPRSFSNASEKTEQNDSKSHPRGRQGLSLGRAVGRRSTVARASPSTGPQWSTSTSSNRSYVHTPPRGFNQHEIQRSLAAGGVSETWSVKEERPGMGNHGELKKYYKDYGEVANSFVPAEAVGRMSSSLGGGTLIAYSADGAASQQGSQAFSDFSSANSFHSQNGHHRYPIQNHGAMHGQSVGVPRNRRDSDRWMHHPRNDKSSVDRSSTPDSIGSHSLIRRGGDASEPKRIIRNQNLVAQQRIFEPLLKPVRDGGSDEDGHHHHQNRPLDQFFHSHQSSFRRQSNARHRNRHGSPRDDRGRFPLKDADFPALDAVRASKRPSSPSSQSGTPKASEKHAPATTR